MGTLYDYGRKRMLEGDLDWANATINCALVDGANFTPNFAESGSQFYSAISDGSGVVAGANAIKYPLRKRFKEYTDARSWLLIHVRDHEKLLFEPVSYAVPLTPAPTETDSDAINLATCCPDVTDTEFNESCPVIDLTQDIDHAFMAYQSARDDGRSRQEALAQAHFANERYPLTLDSPSALIAEAFLDLRYRTFDEDILNAAILHQLDTDFIYEAMTGLCQIIWSPGKASVRGVLFVDGDSARPPDETQMDAANRIRGLIATMPNEELTQAALLFF